MEAILWPQLKTTGICHWLAHHPDGGPAHNPPLTGICSLTLAHPPAACGGAGQISNKKAPSSKLVVLFLLFCGERGILTYISHYFMALFK